MPAKLAIFTVIYFTSPCSVMRASYSRVVNYSQNQDLPVFSSLIAHLDDYWN